MMYAQTTTPSEEKIAEEETTQRVLFEEMTVDEEPRQASENQASDQASQHLSHLMVPQLMLPIIVQLCLQVAASAEEAMQVE